MNFFDDDVLGQLDLNELEIMRERAHHFLSRVQFQVELKNSTARPLSRFTFQESGFVFYAEKVEDGVLINPALPPNFGNRDISTRPSEELERWLCRPYIETREVPSGTRYIVHCLDGGAWDRPTDWGSFASLNDALVCISERC